MGGPGVDFTDLPPAVATASPGDAILIHWGTGAPYGFDLTIHRGVSIIGCDTVPIKVEGGCFVRGLPVGDLCLIHNVDVTARGRVPTGLVVEDCQGLVLVSGLVDDIDYNGGQSVRRSPRVVYTDCRMITPFVPLIIEDSGVWFMDCDVRSPGPSAQPFFRGAIAAARSDLWMIGGYVKGPDGVGNDCGVTLTPEIGIGVFGGRVVLAGGARIEGGLCAATRYRATAMYQEGNPGHGIVGWQVRDPNVVFMDRAVTAPSGFPLVDREIPSVFPRTANRGQRQAIDVIGPSNGIVSVYASFAHGFAPIPLPVGDVWLDPSLTLHIATGPVDAQRCYQATTTIPSWLPVGSSLVYQAVALTPSGRFELSTPGFAVVL
jgi:hypothetical protein